MGLKGSHEFSEKSVQAILAEDFKKCSTITLDNDVATANNRIEFLLDTAERRIRDAALCGWDYRGGLLEHCLELFVNGYFIEIVKQLGAFFETEGLRLNLKVY